MNIKAKLLVLVSSTQLMLALAVSLYFLIMAPIDTLQMEYSYFQALARSADNLRIELNRLSNQALTSQQTTYEQAITVYQASFDDLSKITLLPQVNSSMPGTIADVISLRDTSASTLDDLRGDVDTLIADTNALGLEGSVTLTDILEKASGNDEAAGEVRSHVHMMQSDLRSANEILAATARTIASKDADVNREIATIRERSTLVALSVALGIIILVTASSLLMARGIARSMEYISRLIGTMGTGDLTCRFNLTRRDEIGALGRNLDHLLENLNAALSRIREASVQNRRLRQELMHTVTDSTTSSVEIGASSESISRQMERMDQMIESTGRDMADIGNTIKVFHERLGAQNRHVEDSVSAVTEMLASISNVTRIAEHDRQSAEQLVDQAARGKEIFEQAFEKVAEITESVSAIQDMASVIAGVASQTNILAMNAAIEAAHAGEFGKGFAVVADEIGKLATTSAASSEEIARTIAAIVVKITEAGATRATTTQAFNDISARIREVSDSAAEIHGNVSEMQIGSRQILGAMQELRETSTAITDESGRIERAAAGVQSTMASLGRISNEVTGNIGEIALGMQMISRGVQAISGQAEEIGQIGQVLDQSVDLFRLTGPSQQLPGPIPPA